METNPQRRDVITIVLNGSPNQRWWYDVQFHLQHFCRFHFRRFNAYPTYKDVFDICYKRSSLHGRCCRELFPELFDQVRPWSIGWAASGSVPGAFGFVQARGLGCAHLGCSITEVLGTINCMMYRRTTRMIYCRPRGPCGCASLSSYEHPNWLGLLGLISEGGEVNRERDGLSQ